jgi:hypothetical protein
VTMIPLRIHETRTLASPRESPRGLNRQIASTRSRQKSQWRKAVAMPELADDLRRHPERSSHTSAYGARRPHRTSSRWRQRPKSPTFGDVDDARPTPRRPRSRIQEGGYGPSERLGPTSSLSARLDRPAHNRSPAQIARRLSSILAKTVRDQAPGFERRSHSSKPRRPRRASPNGTGERSSTYRASGSLTTSRLSPTAFR